MQNRLYNYLFKTFLEKISSKDEIGDIVIDKKYDKQALRDNFYGYLKDNLEQRSIPATLKQQVSFNDNCLQVVDFVAWAINRKYNGGDDQYYKIIEGKIINKNI